MRRAIGMSVWLLAVLVGGCCDAPEGESGMGDPGAGAEGITAAPMAETPLEPTPPPPAVPEGEAKSSYTSVALHKDCMRRDEPADERDWSGDYSCPGFGGYEVSVGTADMRSQLWLKGHGVDKTFVDDPGYVPPGRFEALTEKVIEWRYKVVDGDKQTYALIFRMMGQDFDTDKDVSRLEVVRLMGSKACMIGSTTSNEEARQIADDPALSCP
jgi:hypothetical protein